MAGDAPGEGELATYPPGTSPFRGKGLIYLASKQFAEQQLPGGWAGVLDHVRYDDELTRFLGQPFLAASWYDALPMAPLTRAGARAAGLSLAVFSRRRGEWQAQHDVRGVYQTLLRLTSPEVVVERIVRVTSQLFDFGSARLEQLGERHFRLVRAGVPRPLVSWYAALSEPYCLRLLRLAGAQDPVFRPDPVVADDGIAHGVPTFSISYEARWR
ncbi:MAG TPA: hypothetical protein VFS43_45980 [Polyangiaceae bacterium]|nr:hypothetical protein [Polyangiaceae bacterium]